MIRIQVVVAMKGTERVTFGPMLPLLPPTGESHMVDVLRHRDKARFPSLVERYRHALVRLEPCSRRTARLGK
jgi:hypothetical protein